MSEGDEWELETLGECQEERVVRATLPQRSQCTNSVPSQGQLVQLAVLTP